MQIAVEFKNTEQRSFYYSTARNQCFSGGFNNGKTFIGVLKSLSLLLTFSNYRMIIARQAYTDLKRTTMETFLKMCPTELVESHNNQDGLTVFKNGSQVYWLHLDKVDKSTLRGIEPNSILVDQAEETHEEVYDVLDGRLGRWDGAIVPQELLDLYPNWPYKNSRPVVPSYLMLLCNPESEFHYIYRKYHPESEEREPENFFVNGAWDRELGSEETYDKAIKRDDEWVDKYVKGVWGTSGAAIHRIRPESILEPTETLIERIQERGSLVRILDHGDSAPSCCGWFASVGGVYIAYREYYVGGQVISYHRRAISDLSGKEYYTANYADPQIFKKTAQKNGRFYTIAEEYNDSALKVPALHWLPADNNEFATRNRINELLLPSDRYIHPILGTRPAPGLYFIKATNEYPNGCKEIIRQTGAQRKKLLGTLDGKNLYDDARDDNITDHGYDVVRYFVAQHGVSPSDHQKSPPRNSFAYYNAVLKARFSQRGVSI